MGTETLKRKLSSRKLWAAVAGVIAGLAMVFGLDEGVITSVSGAVVSVASIIVYIITEGRVDAAAVKTAVEDVQSAADALAAGASPRPADGTGGVSYTAEEAPPSSNWVVGDWPPSPSPTCEVRDE